jgi:hypothetical protein
MRRPRTNGRTNDTDWRAHVITASESWLNVGIGRCWDERRLDILLSPSRQAVTIAQTSLKSSPVDAQVLTVLPARRMAELQSATVASWITLIRQVPSPDRRGL